MIRRNVYFENRRFATLPKGGPAGKPEFCFPPIVPQGTFALRGMPEGGHGFSK